MVDRFQKKSALWDMVEKTHLDMQSVAVNILVPLFGVAAYDNKLSPPSFTDMRRAQSIIGEIAPKTITVGLGPRAPEPGMAPRPRR